MKNILLTGGTGFIGSNILDHFSKNYKITALVRKKKKYKKVHNVKYLYFKDLKNLKKNLNYMKFYAVIHCATHYRKNHSYEDIKKMIDANIYLGNIILENYKQLKFQKFLNFTTTWENFMAKKNSPANLYSAYKLSFSNIISYYSKKLNKVKFYNLYLSETFGTNDKRKKLFNQLRENYTKNKITTINSKNLSLNVTNVKDIMSGASILLKRNIKAGNYSIINKRYINIYNLILLFNKKRKKKFKLRWKSSKLIKEKILTFKKIPGWFPTNSNFDDLIKYIGK